MRWCSASDRLQPRIWYVKCFYVSSVIVLSNFRHLRRTWLAKTRGNEMTQAVQKESDPVLQWVTFRLGEEVYGVNVMQVQEVLRVTEVAPVPGAPHYVLGIVNLRGNVVTVMDTRSRFGLPTAELDDASRIVIIETQAQVFGMLVDSVAEVVDLRASQIDPTPNVGTDESARYLQGVASMDGDLLILVDLDRLLSDEEWDELNAV